MWKNIPSLLGLSNSAALFSFLRPERVEFRSTFTFCKGILSLNDDLEEEECLRAAVCLNAQRKVILTKMGVKFLTSRRHFCPSEHRHLFQRRTPSIGGYLTVRHSLLCASPSVTLDAAPIPMRCIVVFAWRRDHLDQDPRYFCLSRS